MSRNSDFDKSLVEWLRSAATPIATVEPGSGLSDLEIFRGIVGDARILSLGEATHGAREFFKAKHRILEFCVTELDFSVFGIEAPFSESLAVNDYVLNGVGSARDALVGLRYWVWNTEEVLDLVEWMRRWNARDQRKIKFYGFVTGDAAAAARELVQFLTRVAPELAEACETELAPLTSDLTAELFGQLPAGRRQAIFERIERVLEAFVHRRGEWISATSDLDWRLGRLHAKHLQQAARIAVDADAVRHDDEMAENVTALLEAEGPGSRALLWSHNVHAARMLYPGDEKSMGQRLAETFGRRQVVVGFSFDRGSFRARTYPTGEIKTHEMTSAVAGGFDAILARTQLPLFVLDLANAPREGIVGAWLSSEISMRSIGGIFGFPDDNKLGVAYTSAIKPRECFDAMLFVAETTASWPNQIDLRPPAPVILPSPSNLELIGEGVPDAWLAVRAPRGRSTAITISQVGYPVGGRMLRLSRSEPWRWTDVRLVQRVSARPWRGTRVRFGASVRTLGDGLGVGALLFLKILAEPDGEEAELFTRALATHASNPEPVRSLEWKTLSIEADIPREAHSFVIGLVWAGDGEAWFGDLDFSVLGGSESTLPDI